MSLFISTIEDKDEKLRIADKIKSKYNQVPNSSFIMLWFQRLYLKINNKEVYDEVLCKIVNDEDQKVWNNDWLNNKLDKIIEKAGIVDYNKVKNLRRKVTKKEIKRIVKKKKYYK